MSESRSLFSLARSKLHLSVGGRGDCSLHKWVLLKNSIVRSTPSSPTTSTEHVYAGVVNSVKSISDGSPEDEEISADEEVDSFMFPDASEVVDRDAAAGASPQSEAQWLDSLLDELGDEDDEELAGGVDMSVEPVDEDDEDSLMSPSISPLSSSDDLVSQSQPAYYPPPIAIPYPVPYPPYQPHMRTPFDLDCAVTTDAPLDPSSHHYADALPYSYFIDDVEDLSVPDAIEDTSDDESDLPSTPSLSFQRSPVGFGPMIEVDPASIPLPEDRRPRPHVYIDSDDSHFYPFELDPLPFRDEEHLNSYNPVYQEC